MYMIHIIYVCMFICAFFIWFVYFLSYIKYYSWKNVVKNVTKKKKNRSETFVSKSPGTTNSLLSRSARKAPRRTHPLVTLLFVLNPSSAHQNRHAVFEPLQGWHRVASSSAHKLQSALCLQRRVSETPHFDRLNCKTKQTNSVRNAEIYDPTLSNLRRGRAANETFIVRYSRFPRKNYQ